MDIFIYFSSKLTMSIDIIEEALDKLLNGNGEVTGTGTGESGSNVDIEIFESDVDEMEYIRFIKTTLQQLQVPQDTIIKFEDKIYSIYQE
jgi:hypothetical protein